jgi:hypothetical protein
VARSLAGAATTKHLLLTRGGCAAWRVARAVTGRLRAQPSARWQKDAGILVVTVNALIAAIAALGTRRDSVLKRFAGELKLLARELDDARALTWVADLSDSFGRSQVEVRSLLSALADEARGRLCDGAAARDAPPVMTPVGSDAPHFGPAAAADWPYLGFYRPATLQTGIVLRGSLIAAYRLGAARDA